MRQNKATFNEIHLEKIRKYNFKNTNKNKTCE